MKKNLFFIKTAKKRHHWWLIMVIVFISAACGAISFKEKAEAAPSNSVYIEPATLTKSKNETFTLDAKINPGTYNVSAVELHITFDFSKIRLDSITANTAAGAFPDILTPAQINNTNGTASIVLGSGSSGYVSAVTTIATLSFTAIGEGAADITVPSSTRAAAQLQGSTDVITTRLPGLVTVSARTYTLTDFQNIAGHWLQNVSGENNGDYNSDGTANARDIGIVMHSWRNE